MKDRVFIAWSGSKATALLVKKILETQYNYVCSVGGNSDNNSQFASVGDTVIQQIKNCNQAIVIFQNREDGAVSNNLFFELGFVFAMYGQKKTHCVKRAREEVVLPSDFDNSFVEPIAVQEDKGDQSFAEGIVEYFIGRQKMSVNENKMFLINNRYLIHDKIVSHYSKYGSKCSDYELAQYILYYLQAAHMFGDEEKVLKEIVEFKNKHNFEFSAELALAVELCIAFFEMTREIKEEEQTNEVYIEPKVFWKFKKEYEHFLESISEDEIGIFDEWVRVYILEHLSFGYMLFSNNTSIDDNLRLMSHVKTRDCVKNALESIAALEACAPCKENNDEKGIISLFKAYLYRNMYVAKAYLHESDAIEWLKLTLHERESLKSTFGRGAIDTQLYENFCMEYYLALVNYLEVQENMDPFEIQMYKNEMEEYLDSVRKDNNESAYLHQIERWCEKQKV